MQVNDITASPSWGLANRLHARRRVLAEAVVAAQMREMPGHFQNDDELTHAARVDEAQASLEQLAQALAFTDPILFLDHIAWLKSALGARGVPKAAIRRSLELLNDVLNGELGPASLTSANRLIAEAIQRMDAMPDSPPAQVVRSGPLAEVAQSYCSYLLAGDKESARALVLDRVEAGTPVDSILLHVFEPVQRELGRLWQTAQINVAQEHFATDVTQTLMAQLAGRFARPGNGHGTLVAACVENELHDVGLRLVSDLFQLNGWRTHFLGANTPKDAILRAVKAHRPDVVALSVTISYRTWHLADVIGELRRQPEAAHTHVLVGGYPFKVSPSLADWIGADATAGNAAEAFQTAERMLTA